MYSIKFLLLLIGLCLAADSKLSRSDEAAVTEERIQNELVEVYKERICHIDVIRKTFGDILGKVCDKCDIDKMYSLKNMEEELLNFHNATDNYLAGLGKTGDQLNKDPKIDQETVNLLVESTRKYLKYADIAFNKLCSAFSLETEEYTKYQKSVEALKKDVDLKEVFETQEGGAFELTKSTIELLLGLLDSLNDAMKKDVVARLDELSKYASKDESREAKSDIKEEVGKLSLEDTKDGEGEYKSLATNPKQ